MSLINISEETFKKLETIASKSGKSLEDCVDLALCEYIENFEDFYHTDLNSVSTNERSFFLSLDK